MRELAYVSLLIAALLSIVSAGILISLGGAVMEDYFSRNWKFSGQGTGALYGR